MAIRFFICDNCLHCDPKNGMFFFFGVTLKTVAKNEKKAKLLKKK